MKRKLQIIFGAAVLCWVAASSALAQDPLRSSPDRRNETRERQLSGREANRLCGAAKATDLIGITVKNNRDEKLGKVEDLAVDMESGRVLQVILSTGGFLGLGDTQTAVPPGALHHDVAQKVLHLDADKEKLKGSPRFDTSRWAEYSDSNHLAEVYRYYGEEPAFTFIHRGDAVLDGLRNPGGQVIKDGQHNPDGVPRRADRISDKDHVSTSCTIPASRLRYTQKASKLIGTPVRNLQDEKLGQVDDMLVDLPSGRIVAVVVSSGGFLGVGDDLSAVPPAAFRFNTDRDTLQLDASREKLSNSPRFKANQWPDFSEPVYSERVYRAYRVDPYFTTNATRQPDNTARNVRDRDDRSLTPLDQGNNRADLDTTAQIRKEIIAGKDMSVNARNVKIITQGGRVTLRGPVNSAEEKRLIGEIAERIARSENVDNQLEIKPTNE